MAGALLLGGNGLQGAAGDRRDVVEGFQEFMTATNHELEVSYHVFPNTAPVHRGSLGFRYEDPGMSVEALEQANGFLYLQASNSVCCRFNDLYWGLTLPLGPHPARPRFEVYDSAPGNGNLGRSSGPPVTVRLVQQTSFRWITQLGVTDARPGTIRWAGNEFHARHDTPEGEPLGGHLQVRGGLPAELDLTCNHRGDTVLTTIEYRYDRTLALPYYPSSMVISRTINHRLVSAIPISVLATKQIETRRPASFFDPERFLQPLGTNIEYLTYSNDWPYAQVQPGGALKPLPVGLNPVAIAIQRQRRSRLWRLIAVGLLISVLAPLGAWWALSGGSEDHGGGHPGAE